MKLVKNDMYLLLIDEGAEIKEGDYNCPSDFWDISLTSKEDLEIVQDKRNGYLKVIAYYPLTKEAQELDLPLLPNPFEEVITDIAEKYAWNCKNEFTTKLKSNELVKASTRDFIAGYKAAQSHSKQFSLEDIKKAMDCVYSWMIPVSGCLHIEGVRPETLEELKERFIQSISTQQLPKEFILGIGDTIEEQVKNGHYVY